MRIAFVDFTGFDYTPMTPRERPLGGMQSALCYLSESLAARGHDVSLINKTNAPGQYRGVNCLSMHQSLPNRFLWSLDVAISISGAGLNLRRSNFKCPLILWTGHDTDQVPVASLANVQERDVWSRIVLASDWQAQRFANAFRIKKEKIRVVRNAIAPTFDALHRNGRYFFETARPPVLIYSSTPFRGLHILLKAFPNIRSHVPGCTARIYS